jgi:hypothetical protein
MSVRCKFKCMTATGTQYGWSYSFSVVHTGSEENATFFSATPSGKLEIGSTTKQCFEPGKEYYIDIVES